jgi:hypothetical protein
MKKIKTCKKRILIDCLNKIYKLLFQKIKVFLSKILIQKFLLKKNYNKKLFIIWKNKMLKFIFYSLSFI